MLRTVLCMVVMAGAAFAQNSAMKQLEFLLGNWTGFAGEKDTPLGAGSGDYSFEAQLDRHIIVRRNRANYDSGQTHDDLMIVYFEDPGSPRAIFFDGEGHVIHYRATFPSAGSVVFESDSAAPGPRFRL